MPHLQQTKPVKKSNTSKKTDSPAKPARIILMKRAEKPIGVEPPPPVQHQISQTVQPAPNGVVFVKQKHVYFKVTLSGIKHITAKDNYINIFTGDKNYLVRTTMKEMEAILPPQFVRIHRSHIVNSEFLDWFTNEEAMVDGKSLPVAPDWYKQLFRKLFLAGD